MPNSASIKDVHLSNQSKRYSSPLRLWHWLNAVVITGSLITVLINSTITNVKPTAALIKNEIQMAGANVTPVQAISAAHALADRVWNTHIYFGYALSGLLLFRLVLELFQVADQKFIRKLRVAYTQFKAVKTNRETKLHEGTVKIIYVLFYLLLLVMVVTGLFLAFEDALAAYKSIRHTIKSIHGFCMYLILAFIIIHIAGVFLAERKQSPGIVSDMINGGND